ncbi:helix-turn-helix domain-containing protein [Salmonella enterica subsp. enterica]|nr:helix-turn-helix domain-containing protein [Salmonella enterica subsp. enterica]
MKVIPKDIYSTYLKEGLFMKLSDRLAKAMEFRGISQNKLAQLCGVPQSMVWKLLHDRAKSTGKIVQMANALNIDANWLATGEGEMILPADVPVTYDGLFPVDLYDEKGYKTGRRIMVPNLIESETCKAFLLSSSQGCSIAPAGSIIVIDPSACPFHDDYVYAKDGDTASVYRYVSAGKKRYLAVDDERVPLLPVVEPVEIVGVIVSLIRDLRK